MLCMQCKERDVDPRRRGDRTKVCPPCAEANETERKAALKRQYAEPENLKPRQAIQAATFNINTRRRIEELLERDEDEL